MLVTPRRRDTSFLRGIIMADYAPPVTKRGRPSKLNLERTTIIIAVYRRAGVSDTTFAAWLRSSPDFRDLVAAAEKEGESLRISRRAVKPNRVVLSRRRIGGEIGRKDRYGLTEPEYDMLHRDQSGVCCICKKPETVKHRNGSIRCLAVDHCHLTGMVRGLLCSRCNTALGLLGDDTERVERALEYLRRFVSNG